MKYVKLNIENLNVICECKPFYTQLVKNEKKIVIMMFNVIIQKNIDLL